MVDGLRTLEVLITRLCKLNSGVLRNLTHLPARYLKPTYLDALDRWNAVAKKEGTSKALLAYRWAAYHSILKVQHGDALILGASSLEQIHDSMQGLKDGPLKEDSVKAIEEIWNLVKGDAPHANV
jgi:aflatoxin B1 aldehyde reductase